MPKRLTAALAALLTFAAVLAVVPFTSAEPADAHTKTTQRCDYDPISGQQFNCRRVPVSHRHTTPKCPAGTTGTPPNCMPIPSDNTRSAGKTTKCPAGTTGTPPDCQPIPSDNTRSAATPTTAAPPPPTTTQPPPPPTTTQPPPPPQCVPPAHRYGNGCHTHGYDAPCGTGLWVPHDGHTPQVRTPCPPPTTEPKDKEPTACEPTQRVGQKVRERHRHPITRNRGGADSGCHYVETSHCPAGQHEHGHGTGACHNIGNSLASSVSFNQHAGATHHCTTAGEHEHPHGSGNCHDADTIHCPDGQHGHDDGTWPKSCHAATPKDHHCQTDGGTPHWAAEATYQHKHDGLPCHPANVDNCPAGQHEHTAPGVFPRVAGCHNKDTQHNSGDLTLTQEIVHTATGEVVCLAAGRGAGKAAQLVRKGAKWLSRMLTGQAVDFGVNQGCSELYDLLIKEEARQHEADKKKDHNDHADDKADDDSANSETEPPTTQPPPTTAPPFDPATECHTWFPSLRACINIGPDGRATITYH